MPLYKNAYFTEPTDTSDIHIAIETTTLDLGSQATCKVKFPSTCSL